MPVAWIQTWLRVQATVWLPVLVAIAVSGSDLRGGAFAVALALAIAASLASLAVRLRAKRPADIVTLVRVAMTCGVVAMCERPLPIGGWLLLVVAAAADLVDGALARRTGPTPEGALLDMEADQLTVLALSVCIVQSDGMPHVLLLPAMRYAFVLAAWFWRIPAHEPKPVDGDNRRGRAICAAVVVALLIASAPSVPRIAGGIATAGAVALLVWSFSADARHLLAARRRQRQA